jgi:hypothetical protein
VFERAQLATAVRQVIRFDHANTERTQTLREIVDQLVGDSLPERLETILRTRIWDLGVEDRGTDQIPDSLVEIADALAEDEARGLELALSAGRHLDDQSTRFELLRLLATRIGAPVLAERALRQGDWTAVTAALSTADAAGEGEWATGLIRALAEAEPSRVPGLLTYLSLNPARLHLALDLVEREMAAGTDLAPLLYGARIRELDEPDAVRLVQAVQASGNFDAAIGMLEQWIAVHPELSDGLRQLASRLGVSAMAADPTALVEYEVGRLVSADAIDSEALIRLLQIRFESGHAGSHELEQLVAARLMSLGDAIAPRIYDLVRTIGYRAVIGADELALLSRLASATSAEAVWNRLSEWPENELRFALHHMRWDGSQPDPLVREFLTSPRLAELEDEAFVCFSNTLGVVMGPYHTALGREVERAKSWRDDLAGTSGMEWADKVIAEEQARVEWHRKHEEEERALMA